MIVFHILSSDKLCVHHTFITRFILLFKIILTENRVIIMFYILGIMSKH